jgi:hypothetical protein
MILDYAGPDIHLPIAILLIQILDIIFHSNQKSHYISSCFWMPGRIFPTVKSSVNQGVDVLSRTFYATFDGKRKTISSTIDVS